MTEETFVSQRLRAIALAAHWKIHKNRNKNVPGKWHPDGMSQEGERKWKDLPVEWLFQKLLEEVVELYDASRIRVYSGDAYVNAGEPFLEAGDVTAMAMMLADVAGDIPGYKIIPKVVCLCGSTKFQKEFEKANLVETMVGNIVLSVGFFMHSDNSITVTPEQKEALDALHKAKIDLADEILVINVGGYIGDSTHSEIYHAIATGKPIRYLEPWNTSGR